ncbi:MAG TPA: methylated-DNA--[protein]-cysteine S-methyltransferase [Allosphingosinicella sp.]|jgi:methylated-DNA-[protein]-cysteine S-methyltransferase
MTPIGFAWFATPLGSCGIAWSGDALVGIQLPTPDETTRVWISRCRPQAIEAAPPAWVAEVTARVQRLLAGAADDLADVPLDFSAITAFDVEVYRQARRIQPGYTCTYGELAERIGAVGQARAVGQALGRNPWPIIVPCHRVTAADGRTGGFSAPGGRTTKLRLLELEGALGVERLPLFGGGR